MIFGRRKRAPALTAQTRAGQGHPFGLLERGGPMNRGEVRMYRQIREAVPMVDAAIVKLIRLTGGVSAACPDKTAEAELNRFLRQVDCGRGQRGINAFLDSYVDSMITCGQGVGEMVLGGGRDMAALLCGDVAELEVREGRSPLEFLICGRDERGLFRPLPRQELLLFTPYNPEASSPYGVSLLRSMPFLTDILLKIYATIGVNWERAGNVRFAVTYRPKGDALDRAFARERSEELAAEWSSAMAASRGGSVRDFVAVGDVDIKVIGAEGQILDSEVPVRQILEQLVARTGIPPFMLGLSWASTERMSAQQADMLTSEITAIRRTLAPVVERICTFWLGLHGYGCGVEILWDEINLQDAVEEARAEYYLALAQKYRGEKKGEEQA